MTQFEALFGVKKSQIKKNCILLPLVPRGVMEEFKVGSFSKGRLYAVTCADNFSVIRSGLGPAFTGDAVLRLKETSCRNLIFFGSCGLVKQNCDLSIGSLVTPLKSYAEESFSEMLLGFGKKQKEFYCHHDLLNKFLTINKTAGFRKVTCLTLSSLYLQEKLLAKFVRCGIDVVDMESSAFFSAADFSGLRAIAIFYVTDIIKEKPFYRDLDSASKIKLEDSIKKSANFICNFFKKSSGD